MATDPSVVGASRDGDPALHKREFLITRKGYDREEVKAYLAEIEASLCELETWARHAQARLAIAEEKSDSIDEVDKAMMAVFEAKERVLAKARLQAERIEALAMKKARTDAGIAGDGIIAEAQEEARRIVEAALATTTPVSQHELLESGRAQADRLVEEAHDEADRLIREARAEAGKEPDQLGSELESTPQADDDNGGELVVLIDDRDLEQRRSRYERTSAGLPSIGEDAGNVVRIVERLREKPERS
jgi:cell division septum initiation protein DivIVA